MTVYKCLKCDTVVEELKSGQGTLVCCDQPMVLLEPGTSDGAHEKHVPVVKISENKVHVCVGEIAHPMMKEHFIEWIAIETTNGIQIKKLEWQKKPEADFVLTPEEKFKAAYAYCNLHNLWKSA